MAAPIHHRCMALVYIPGAENRAVLCGGKLDRESRWNGDLGVLVPLRGRFCVEHGAAWGRRPR